MLTIPRIMEYKRIVKGWKISAREANCLCCAMESATSFNAATLSASEVRTSVVRGGTPSKGSAGGGNSSSTDVMVARDEGNKGGRVCEVAA